MKSLIYIFTFLFFSIALSAQDTTKTNYKNQVGVDLKPLINGLSTDIYFAIDEIDLLYRRQLNETDWGMVKLSFLVANPFARYKDFDVTDTSFVHNRFFIRKHMQLQLNYSRQFYSREKTNFYYGLHTIFAFGEGFTDVSLFETTFDTFFNRERTTSAGSQTILGRYSAFAIGPSFSFEWNISNRISLLTNMNVLVNGKFGQWTYLDEDLNPVTEIFDDNWTIDYFFIRDIAIMYNF